MSTIQTVRKSRFNSVLTGISHVLRDIGVRQPRRVEVTHPTGSFEMFGDWRPGAGLGTDFSRNGCHEPVGTEYAAEAARRYGDGFVAWDVGAAYGYYSRLVRSVAPGASVHAFEGDDARLPILSANAAVPDGRFTVVPRPLSRSLAGGVAPVEYAREHGTPSLVKCDVDGGEADLLPELGAVFAADRDQTLLLEMHSRERHDEARNALSDLLATWTDPVVEVCFDHRDADATFDEIPSDDLPTRADVRTSDYIVAVRER